MAHILKKQESLDSVASRKKRRGWTLVIIGILISFRFWPPGTIIGIVLIIMGLRSINKGDRFHMGAVGEKMVSDFLSSYPDDWYIFNDMIVKSSQIDHIVVCPKGVYTIETKNYQGTVYGDTEENRWIQATNKKHERSFYNPVKQGKKHSADLGKYIEECGYDVWVNTIVIFTDPTSKLEVSSHDVPVLYLDELNDYFKKQKKIMKQDMCEKMVKCISELIPK
jgi:hypothetical protein